MNLIRNKIVESEYIFRHIAHDDSNVGLHIIWDVAAAMLSGIKYEAHSDIVGSLMNRLVGSNAGVHDVYYLGEFDKYVNEYNQLSITLSSNARTAWENKERADDLAKWLNRYEDFVNNYKLGTGIEEIGDCWKWLIQDRDTERMFELIEGLTILHDEILPVFKSELKEIIKEYFSEEVENDKSLDEDYKVIRKLQADMIKFLKKERTYLCAEDFCRLVKNVTDGRIKFESLDFPRRWTQNEFVALARALEFAARAHEGDTRKGTDIPYIVHPIEASIVTMGISDDVEVSIAALLHDVVEDTDFVIEDIIHEFGGAVAELVGYESEDKMRNMAVADSWKIRKVAFLEHLANAPLQAKIICLGDKVSNMRQSVKTHKEKGDDMWLVFNQKDKKEQEWYYRSIYESMPELAETGAYKEYVSMCNKVFK